MKRNVSLLCIVLLLISFYSCAVSPLSYNDTLEVFMKHKDEFLIIVDFLQSLDDYDSVNISKFNGTIFANLHYIDIKDKTIVTALSEIHNAGCNDINKKGEQISFELWSSFTDIGCGLLYSDKKIHTAEDCNAEQYITAITPLEELNWYYYISDYNLWRSQHQSETNVSPIRGRFSD